MNKPFNNLNNNNLKSLNERKIKPSLQAWDRIDAMLATSKQSKPYNHSWLKYVAMFLIVSVLSIFFYNNKSEVIKKSTDIVDTENLEKDSILDKVEEVENHLEALPIKSYTKQKIVLNNKNKQSHLFHEKMNLDPNIGQINESVEEKIASNQSSKMIVDAQLLLAEVEKEMIAVQPVKSELAQNTQRIKIDAQQLLDETEYELNQTFKTKALEKVNKQFKNLKEALVKTEN